MDSALQISWYAALDGTCGSKTLINLSREWINMADSALSGMQRILLILLLAVLVSTPADARWRHHHHYHHGPKTAQHDPAQSPMLVPPGWQRQPADPNWPVERYLSPDGTGSFSAYITPVAQEPIAQHMKTVAFVDGEQITRLRGEKSWIEVSGFKGNRIFYRKSVLACGGTSWHEIAFEYPAEAHGMKVFVDRAANAVEINRDKGCPASVATSNASSNIGEQPSANQGSGAQ
jgi:serine/threonine-protein kinase